MYIYVHIETPCENDLQSLDLLIKTLFLDKNSIIFIINQLIQ